MSRFGGKKLLEKHAGVASLAGSRGGWGGVRLQLARSAGPVPSGDSVRRAVALVAAAQGGSGWCGAVGALSCVRADGSCGPVDGLQGAEVGPKVGARWLFRRPYTYSEGRTCVRPIRAPLQPARQPLTPCVGVHRKALGCCSAVERRFAHRYAAISRPRALFPFRT